MNTKICEENTCPICLEDFCKEKIVIFGHCTHFLCTDCYKYFTKTSNKCPLCRVPIEDELLLLRTNLTNLSLNFGKIVQSLEKLQSINSASLIVTHANDFGYEISQIQNYVHICNELCITTGIISSPYEFNDDDFPNFNIPIDFDRITQQVTSNIPSTRLTRTSITTNTNGYINTNSNSNNNTNTNTNANNNNSNTVEFNNILQQMRTILSNSNM